MTISYTDMETGTSTAVAAGTELTNLNAAILAYTAKISTPAARTSELETLKTTLNAAFATISS